MWNDNETNIDLIDYSYLIDATRSIINNKTLLPCTIGIFGDWGSGKSSLMKMIEQSYKKDENVLCVKFNGWLFEGYEDAKTALLSTIIKQTISERTFVGDAKAIAKKLLKSIDWLKVAKTATKHGLAFLATGGVGNIVFGINDLVNLDAEKAKKMADSFSDGRYDDEINMLQNVKKGSDKIDVELKEFHKNFGELLEETKVDKLIVFIDDLDRCDPNTVIETLEAIKLFLFAPNTVFVIGADERLIKYAVKRRFPEIPGEKEVSRDYLEKLVQLPIRIPSLSTHELQTYINLLFIQLYYSGSSFDTIRQNILSDRGDKLFESIINSSNISKYISGNIPPDLMDDLILSEQIVHILSTGLNGNPRQCKRFLNTLVIRMQMAISKGIKLQKRVLAKIMLLEYFKPESFKTLFKWQIETGKSYELKLLEDIIISKSQDMNSTEIDTIWIDDSWLNSWLRIEPKLQDEDLRPYFFFTKESLLNKQFSSATRMSSNAQEVLNLLLSSSDSVFTAQLSIFRGLPLADSTAIYEEFSSKIKQAEEPKERITLSKRLLELAKNKDELKSEVLTFFENLPAKNISASLIPKIIEIFNEETYQTKLIAILSKWSSQVENKSLSKAADSHLKKIK
ncbi:MAG: P-loop NTPase fold protein [Dysgonamonadaceae bacterium]|jgi:predicted KAP-like P-loop ATPase|nr:hypothetical protein [Dysgonomonas mossii]MEA5080445.1 P-loop NTPase fold protein [Dysgonamonadaceae bacterium]